MEALLACLSLRRVLTINQSASRKARRHASTFHKSTKRFLTNGQREYKEKVMQKRWQKETCPSGYKRSVYRDSLLPNNLITQAGTTFKERTAIEKGNLFFKHSLLHDLEAVLTGRLYRNISNISTFIIVFVSEFSMHLFDIIPRFFLRSQCYQNVNGSGSSDYSRSCYHGYESKWLFKKVIVNKCPCKKDVRIKCVDFNHLTMIKHFTKIRDRRRWWQLCVMIGFRQLGVTSTSLSF